jgi:hypothetical protein
MTNSTCPFLISALLVGCASLASSQVYTTRPTRPHEFAEISFTDTNNQKVDVWKVENAHGGLAQTDYVSLPTPLWVRLGNYKFTYGCPGRAHSYGTKAVIRVGTPGKYHLSCGASGELTLVAEQT